MANDSYRLSQSEYDDAVIRFTEQLEKGVFDETDKIEQALMQGADLWGVVYRSIEVIIAQLQTLYIGLKFAEMRISHAKDETTEVQESVCNHEYNVPINNVNAVAQCIHCGHEVVTDGE